MGRASLQWGRREFTCAAVGTAAFLESQPVRAVPSAKGKTGFLYDSVYLKHRTTEGHPEKPGRLIAIEKAIRGASWFNALLLLHPREADLDTVALVHTRQYIEKVRKECESGSTSLSTGDTAICRESYSVALQAAGGVLEAVDAVMTARARNVFCAVRPPGHHATPNRGMGFCIFNNVAIGARYAQKKYKVPRVLIADWDVHHGNGTQEVFYRDGTIFYMSTHQSPLYPGTGKREETGEGPGAGTIMNLPFPRGAGNKEIIGAYRGEFLSAARQFKPDLTFISAGFDSRAGDLLGGFALNDDGFRELTRIMIEIAGIGGQGRLISVLEGGYNIEGLASAVRAHIEVLLTD